MRKVILSGALLSAGIGAGVGAAVLVTRGTRWGSTSAERTMALPGDSYLASARQTRTVMTRAISIVAPPEVVWPWLAQLGRGAGWYSFDRLDNDGTTSARHIVSWIPEPQIGDAAAIGWLRQVEPNRSLTWWIGDTQFLGASARMVTDSWLDPEAGGSRLVIRMSADATGHTAPVAVRVFEVIDSIMAVRQLKGVKARAEAFGARTTDPDAPETGARAQYQTFEAIWASGETCGIAGRETAVVSRQAALAAGVLRP